MKGDDWMEGRAVLTAQQVRELPEGSWIQLHYLDGNGEHQIREGYLKKRSRFSADMIYVDMDMGAAIGVPVRDIEHEYWTKA